MDQQLFHTLFIALVTFATAQHPGHLHGPPGHHNHRPHRPFGHEGGGFPHGFKPGAIPPAPVVPAQSTPAIQPVPAAPVNLPNAVKPAQPGTAPIGTNNAGLIGLLNGGNFGSASAAGAGNGAVQNGAAIGQGTGIANAGPGGFGIGLGIGGAIATPLGNLAFGTGESLAVGKK